MLDLLINIPGPQFLKLFAVYSIAVIFLGWLWTRLSDPSLKNPSPNPKNFDPLEIAALKGGRNEVIRAAIFDLWRRDILRFEGTEKDTKVLVKGGQGANDVETTILHFASTGRSPSEFFTDKDLTFRLENILRPIYAKLERAHLLQSADTVRRLWLVFWAAFCLIFSVGGTKLMMGIVRDKPFLFLFFMLVVDLIVLLVVLKPRKHRTSLLGRRYLKVLEKHFAWLKDSVARGEAPDGINPALAVAIFGVTALSGVTMFSPFSEAFAKGRQNTGGGCSGGCGSSSGCGGGGSCGGGCGGCGGGD